MVTIPYIEFRNFIHATLSYQPKKQPEKIMPEVKPPKAEETSIPVEVVETIQPKVTLSGHTTSMSEITPVNSTPYQSNQTSCCPSNLIATNPNPNVGKLVVI